MAQRKQITWGELRVGLFVLVGLLILAVAIFYVTGAGFLGPKYRLKTFLPEVSGLAVGAPVRLDGVEIGNVEKIRLVPREAGKPPDRMHNIEVDIRLDARYQGDILTDSAASLVTEGLLGNRYVNVQRGYTGVPLKEGQTIPGTEEKAIKEVVERSADVLANLKALSEEIQDICAYLVDVCFEGEVAGVKEFHRCFGEVLFESFCAGGNKERVFVAPDGEEGWLVFFEVVVEFGI